MTNAELERLRDLTFQHLDNSLNEQDSADLQLLLQDSEALREFVSLLTLHSRLTLVMGDFGSAMIPSDAQLASADSQTLPMPKSIQSNRWQKLKKPLLLISTLAACLCIVFVSFPNSNSNQDSFVARVVEKIDCDRESERWLTASTASIDATEVINLDRGLMVIEFGDGARVTLEGPSQFEVVSRRRGFLHAGKLTAYVPKRARGFTVGTPSCESVDLGTEFGLHVLDDGSAEAHVFDGEVVLKSIAQADPHSPESHHLTTDMAARVEAGSHLVQSVKVQPTAFTRVHYQDDLPQPGDTHSKFVPSSSQLLLWLDAGRNVQLDELGRVSSWGDIVYGDNVEREDAWQVVASKRPRLIQDAIADKPAVRFDGKSHLVTAPIATADDVTVFCVFARGDQRIPRKKSAMLINFNGPPNLVLEYTWENKFSGRMYQGWANGTTHHGSWLKAPKSSAVEPELAAYVYSYTNNRSELYINGKLVDSGLASAPAAIHSPKFIGKNRDPDRRDHFFGDISEILVFDSAFSSRECARTSQYLLEKYSIPFEASALMDADEPNDQT